MLKKIPKDKENTKDEKTVAMKGSIWKKKKNCVIPFWSCFYYQYFEFFTDLKFIGSCQLKIFIVSAPS